MRILAALVVCSASMVAGCSSDGSTTEAESASESTSAPETPAVLPVDETLRSALGTAVAWTPIDAGEAGARFSPTTVAVDQSIFTSYWAGRGSFRGEPVVAAALFVTDSSRPDAAERLEAQFAQDSPSRQIGTTKVFSQPGEQFLYWYAAPNVIFVQADDGELAVDLVEAMLAG
jgi:hypothetical protein